MATTQVDVMNRALAAIGHVGKTKIALPDEDTSDARTVRRFYDQTLDSFLEETWWSWATKYETLSEDSTDEPEAWVFTYKLPIDCASPRRIVGIVPEDLIEFEEGVNSNGTKVVWTDVRNAELEYTGRIEDFNAWGGAAVTAFSLALARDIAPAFTGGLKKFQIVQAMYEDALEKAIVASHNRQQRRVVESNEFIDDRHGTEGTHLLLARYRVDA